MLLIHIIAVVLVSDYIFAGIVLAATCKKLWVILGWPKLIFNIMEELSNDSRPDEDKDS